MLRIGTEISRIKSLVTQARHSANDAGRSPAAWCALLGLWLFLISPLIMQVYLNKSGTQFDKPLLFSFVTTLLWAGALHFSARRPLTLHLLLLPLYVTTGIDLFLLTTFGSRLSSGYVILGMTSATSSGDFLATYTTPILFFCGLTAVVYLTGLFGIRRLALRPMRKVSLACLALLATGYSGLIARSMADKATFEHASLEVAGYETSTPIGAVFQSGLAIYQFDRESGYRTVRLQHHLGARSVRDNRGEIYVWVIGKSSRAENWSLLGYGRNTNPYLSNEPGILGLPNLLSTAPSTAVAVASMLSPWPLTNWQGILSHRSVVSAFREAGFDTYWFSTQRVDGWSGAIPWLAAEAKHVRYRQQSFDGALLRNFSEALETAAKGKKLFIVLHINGSHFVYSRRYPQRFAHFHHNHASYRDHLIDEYDNSVLYTDWFLHQVIAALKHTHRPAALLFASDHGENLLDDDAHLLGHGIGNAHDLHPAAFIWGSESLRRRNPQMWKTARTNAQARLSSSNLPHTFLDLAGVQIPELNRKLSIFSPTFTTEDRWYIARSKLHRERQHLASK